MELLSFNIGLHSWVRTFRVLAQLRFVTMTTGYGCYGQILTAARYRLGACVLTGALLGASEGTLSIYRDG